MKQILFFTQDERLNPQAFEEDIRQWTHNLNDVLFEAGKTLSPAVETTHFLIALGRIQDGKTQKELRRLKLPLESWEIELAACAHQEPDRMPPAYLTRSSLAPVALEMLQTAKKYCEQYQLSQVSESILLLSALKNATGAVQGLIESSNISLDDWHQRLEKMIKPVDVPPVYDDDGSLALESFSPWAKKTLQRMHSEAEALGYETVDPRHLLLAFLEHDGGVLQYGIHQQQLHLRRIEETVMLVLRGRTRGSRSILPLNKQHHQSLLQHILGLSADLAAADLMTQIAEPHLLRAFLTLQSSATRILEDENIDIRQLLLVAEGYDLSQPEDEDPTMADIDTVRQRLQDRLVGQDNAIERVLPYIQRLRFGFTVPGRPVGVFLFCGQSGSGKTEMAKGLAEAVYGSSENLTFLEMGQFNAPESMNIFVGAPPGYVGYGEGKLTNGLRDKPRSVILFDEVEKAHTKVLDALLRFLDEGKIDDPAGPVRDGTQCLIILTSNLGAEELSRYWMTIKEERDWQARVRQKLRAEFKKHNFRPEFINRVDELILFRTLEMGDYQEITRRLLERDLDRLNQEHHIEVLADESVSRDIGAYCARLDEGARLAQRMTQSLVITPVIDFVLSNNCTPPLSLRVTADKLADQDLEPTTHVEMV